MFFKGYRINISIVTPNVNNETINRISLHMEQILENFNQMSYNENNYKNFYFQNIRNLATINEIIRNSGIRFGYSSEIEIYLYDTLSLLLEYMINDINYYIISENISEFSTIFSDIVYYRNIYIDTGLSEMLEISLISLFILMFPDDGSERPTFNPAFHSQIILISQNYIIVERLNVFPYRNEIVPTNQVFQVYLKNKISEKYVSIYDEFRNPISILELNEKDIIIVVYNERPNSILLFENNSNTIIIDNAISIQKVDL
ncbi:MAG: hypothetical protein FWF57_00100 [Defluviitaleaceae bacterium]|nr:hypothetical protein [Defluviitaleaceae bacterium]